MYIKNILEQIKSIADRPTGENYSSEDKYSELSLLLESAIALFEKSDNGWESDGCEIYSITTTQASLFPDSICQNARHFKTPFILRLAKLGEQESGRIQNQGMVSDDIELLVAVPGVDELDYLIRSHTALDQFVSQLNTIS